jgi:hypothetical protein
MYEMWSLPWHALQKSLAGRIGALGVAGGAVPSSPRAQRKAECPDKVICRRSAACCADSWLNRARCRGAPLPTL